jgi:hypothetical protein
MYPSFPLCTTQKVCLSPKSRIFRLLHNPNRMCVSPLLPNRNRSHVPMQSIPSQRMTSANNRYLESAQTALASASSALRSALRAGSSLGADGLSRVEGEDGRSDLRIDIMEERVEVDFVDIASEVEADVVVVECEVILFCS